jgi:hypothetical protein
MRAAWVLALAVSITSLASAATIDPADAWRPMYSFIGTWKATRTGSDGPVKVTRIYASAPTNHHLEITEAIGGARSRAVVRGMVSFDPQRQGLVLRHFGADGSALDMAFDPAASTTEQAVFVSLESEAARTRITYERKGAKTFVERIERSAGGEPFAVVSETRFMRTD